MKVADNLSSSDSEDDNVMLEFGFISDNSDESAPL